MRSRRKVPTARLCFEAVNAQGGVRGQQLELVALDDKYDAALTAQHGKNLAAQGVLAFMLPAARHGPKRWCPSPPSAHGADRASLRRHELALPGAANVFNLRASFQLEAERAVRHLAQTGVKRITIIKSNDVFGTDAGMGAIKGLEAVGLRVLSNLSYDRAKPNLAPMMQAVAKAGIEAVVLIGPGYAVAEGVQALRAAGSTAHVATLSNNATAEFVKSLGDQARGVIVTQVMPYERSSNNPMVREALNLAKASGRTELTSAHVEGFAAARLVVEALKRVPKDVSRDNLVKALEGGRFDLGGLQVRYTEKDHFGLEFTDVSIIADGKFLR